MNLGSIRSNAGERIAAHNIKIQILLNKKIILGRNYFLIVQGGCRRMFRNLRRLPLLWVTVITGIHLLFGNSSNTGLQAFEHFHFAWPQPSPSKI